MISNYRLEFQPQLVEDAVLRAIACRPEAASFWRERDRLYERINGDDREQAFHELHKRWLQRLGLVKPLWQVFELWPILISETSRCLLIKARTQKNIGAELYIAAEECDLNLRERRTIVVQLTPELLSRPQTFLEFLHHECLHLVDMLNPDFGYEPNFPKSDAGPAYDHFLQGRYSVLWDITIDGRLYQRGWLPPAAREKHFTNFKRAFQGSEEKLAQTFTHFFEQKSPTHRELIEFAQHPEKWLRETVMANSSKGRCAICHFPTFHLINPAELSGDVHAEMQQDYPAWNPAQPICRQCADLYESHALQP